MFSHVSIGAKFQKFRCFHGEIQTATLGRSSSNRLGRVFDFSVFSVHSVYSVVEAEAVTTEYTECTECTEFPESCDEPASLPFPVTKSHSVVYFK